MLIFESGGDSWKHKLWLITNELLTFKYKMNERSDQASDNDRADYVDRVMDAGSDTGETDQKGDEANDDTSLTIED